MVCTEEGFGSQKRGHTLEDGVGGVGRRTALCASKCRLDDCVGGSVGGVLRLVGEDVVEFGWLGEVVKKVEGLDVWLWAGGG